MSLFLELFISFFQIGLCSFGGGYAALPLIQNQVVDVRGWLTLTELADMITISQMTPGPIAINSATFVGTRLSGIPGAVVATLGCVTPSCIIVLTLAYIYYKYKNLSIMQGVLSGLRPAVVALIANAGLSILIMSLFKSEVFSLNLSDINLLSVGIIACCLVALMKFKKNPILVMSCAGIGGLILYFAGIIV